MYYDKHDPTVVHETILKDIVDVLSDVKDIDEIEFELGKNKSFKSIASASSNLTLVFPVLCSTDMDITSAQMISKAIERKCVAMLQILFSAFAINNADDAVEYIKKFHSNMRMTDRMDLDSFVSYVDDFVRKLDETAPIKVDKTLYDVLKEDFKRNMAYYIATDCISESSINDYTVYPSGVLGGATVLKEAPGPSDAYDHYERAIKDVGNQLSRVAYDANRTARSAIRSLGNIRVNVTTGGGGSKKSDNDSQDLKNYAEYFSKQIMPTDIKKANELMPTTMMVNFIRPGKDGADAITTTAIIGVKAKLYPVSSMDIIDRIKAKSKDSNAFNNFIRATTREISFWKDFVFAIDKAKLDALSSSRRGSSSPVWKLLERRAMKSRIRRNLRMTNDATAITTLVMSQNEVEWLLKNDNIDMMNPYTARALMEQFNLLGITIVDESIEVAKFIFDTGDDDYESLTFSSLERESSDSTYKRVVNLMTKMGR